MHSFGSCFVSVAEKHPDARQHLTVPTSQTMSVSQVSGFALCSGGEFTFAFSFVVVAAAVVVVLLSYQAHHEHHLMLLSLP